MFYNILYAIIVYPLKYLRGKGAPQIRGLFPRLKPLHFNPLLGVLWQQACLAWKSPCWLASRPRVPFGFMWFAHTKCWWIEIYLGTEGFVGKLWGMRECENYSGGLRLLEKILHPANNADTSQFLPLQTPCFLLNKGLPRFPFTNLKNRQNGELELSHFLSVTQPVVTGNGIQISQR